MGNYRRGVGQLATSRYDFQNHIDGYGFQHPGGAISCTVTIDGTTYTDVQSALTAISGYVPATIPNATASVTGGIRLTGDLGGTYSSPTVSKLNTKTVTYSSFTSGDVLTWTGSAWTNAQLGGDVTGSATANTVTKFQGRAFSSNTPITNQMIYWSGSQWQPGYPTFGGNDLSGASNDVKVIRATGNGIDPGTFAIGCNSINFEDGMTYDSSIGFYSASVGSGNDLRISAQNTSGTNGGQLTLQGGAGNTGLDGGVVIKKCTGAIGLIHAKEVQSYAEVGSRDIVALCPDTNSLSIRALEDTGDRVVYLGDAAVDPTAAPLNGVILYSSGGEFRVMQEDGNNRTLNIPYYTVAMGSTGAYDSGTQDTIDSISPQPISGVEVVLTGDFYTGDMVRVDFNGVFEYVSGDGNIFVVVNSNLVSLAEVTIDATYTRLTVPLCALYTLTGDTSTITVQIKGNGQSFNLEERWQLIAEVKRNNVY